MPAFTIFWLSNLNPMGALFISLLTLVLLLISGFVILLVLMQRTSQSGGMGAALGGGAAESAFGSDTNTVLTKATIYSIIAFFIVSLGLFLIYQSKASERTQAFNPEVLMQSGAEDDSGESLLTPQEADAVEVPALESVESSNLDDLKVEPVVDEASDVVVETVDIEAAVETPEIPDIPSEVSIEEAVPTTE